MGVFIVRPFGTKGGIDFDQVERELIAPAMAAAGVSGGTTGLIARAGNIRLDMFERLLLADLVIADISVHNANVFYELGIRHALRDRPTILIRFQRTDPGTGPAAAPDEVPFDLKTDRYLEYDRAQLATSVPALTRTIQESLRARNVDSPVYILLPKLRPPSTDTLRGVPEEFREAVSVAAAKNDLARLGLLAEEIGGLDWANAGRRLIGRAFFDRKSWRGARTWLEAVRDDDRDDTEANLLLGTVYQKLGDLAESNAALQRVLDSDGLSSWARAEKRALVASNHKTEWISRWAQEPPNTRAATALRTFPHAAVETYDAAFIEDQNHFYSGLNSLSLRTLQLELATQLPDVWEEAFDDGQQAATTLASARDLCASLRAAVERSIKAAQVRDAARLLRASPSEAAEADVWIDMSWADFRFLTAPRPGPVGACYRQVLAKTAGKSFNTDSAARQLRVFRDLGVFVDRADAALSALNEPATAPATDGAAATRVLVFSGHRVDRPGRTPARFPASRVRAATDAIRTIVATEQSRGAVVTGIAGAANGGDIIFHEVCRQAGIRTSILLALPADEYAAESVNDGGSDWSERYRALLRDTPPLELSSSKELPSWVAERRDYSIWNRNNLWTLHTAFAVENAQLTLIVLWDGQGGDGPGGTADMVDLARRRGVTVIRIDPAALADG